MSYKFNIEQVEVLIDKQFEIAGHNLKMADILHQDDWYINYTTTKDLEDEFIKWAIDYIAKELRINKYKGPFSAKKYVISFIFNYGLKVI